MFMQQININLPADQMSKVDTATWVEADYGLNNSSAFRRSYIFLAIGVLVRNDVICS